MIEHFDVQLAEVRLHVAAAGPADGPVVILLHGFPEFWYGWRHQIPALVEAGYRVLVPDQRGYNLSDKPPKVKDYAIDRLSEDVVGLIEFVGQDQAYLVGHDWGGGVAWWTAMRFPQRVSKLAVLNCPHGPAMERRLRKSFRQLRRSWYMFAFQLPWLPQKLLCRRQGHKLSEKLQQGAKPGAFTDEDLKLYRAAWLQPGAMRSMVHWYRAALRTRSNVTGSLRVEVPTLLIWGTQDAFLGKELATDSMEYCEQGRLEWIESAGHFVQHEEPENVNRLLLEFLS